MHLRGKGVGAAAVASAVLGLTSASAVIACTAFGAAPGDATPGAEGGGGDGTATSDGARVDGGADGPSSEAGPPARACQGSAPFHDPFLFPGTSPLISARLGGDGILYVSRVGSSDVLGTTTFTDGGIDTVSTFLMDGSNDQSPMLTADGRALIFSSDRASGTAKLWISQLASGAFMPPAILAIPTLIASDDVALEDPYLAGDRIYFASKKGGGPTTLQFVMFDPTQKLVLTAPAALVSGATGDADRPVVSADGLELFYDIAADGTLRHSVRAQTTDLFPVGAPIPELTSMSEHAPTWISPDGCDSDHFAQNGGPGALARATRR